MRLIYWAIRDGIQLSDILDNKSLARLRQQRHLLAFVITASAVFALGSLIWPLSTRGFQSQATVAIDLGESESSLHQFRELVAYIAQTRTTDASLEDCLDQIRKDCDLNNNDFVDQNFDRIRDAFSVNLQPTDDPVKLKISFAFQGNGTQDEEKIVEVLGNQLTAAIKDAQFGTDDSEKLAASQQVEEQLDQLDWLVDQIQSDLTSVKFSVAQLNESQNHAAATPFINASHAKTSSAKPSLVGVQQALGSIDTQAVRQQLETLKKNSKQFGVEPANQILPTDIQVSSVGGQPKSAQLIWLALLSIAVGWIVTLNYQPFAKRGFENVGQVASALQVPVLAMLPNRHAATQPQLAASRPWANKVVGYSRLLLLGAALLIIGFCLINEEVRHAFFVNPFHGMARIVWMFVGH